MLRPSLTAIFGLFSSIAVAQDVTIKSHGARAGGVFGEIMVEAKNNSSRTVSRVKVECVVLDAANTPLGATNDAIENIAPGETGYTRALISVPRENLGRITQGRCRLIEAR